METFITELEELLKNNSSSSYLVKRPKRLFKVLREIDNYIGMETYKSSLIRYIKSCVVEKLVPQEQNNHIGFMVNAMICGPPGVGKTMAAIGLARVWEALGIVNSIPKVQKINKKSSTTIVFGGEGTGVMELTRMKEEVKMLRDLLNDVGVICLRQNRMMYKLYDRLSNINSYDEQVVQAKKYAMEIGRDIHNAIDKSLLDQLSETIEVDEDDEDDDEDDEDLDIDSIMVKADRSDFVAEYIGQTVPKCKAFLEKHKGKVIFVDEAYSLAPSESPKDFGLEALSVIVDYLSKSPKDWHIVLCGYREMIENTIFKVQPGLKRRITLQFEIKNYTGKELKQIFILQVGKIGWILDSTVNVKSFFKKNEQLFPHFGGDTEKLLFHCKEASQEVVWKKQVLGEHQLYHTITQEIFDKGVEYYKDHELDFVVSLIKEDVTGSMYS
jgi:SpoVK/Ycf46/Vps4 family AAA+-type ATPase